MSTMQQSPKPDNARFTQSEIDQIGAIKAEHLQDYNIDELSLNTGISREAIIRQLAAAVSVSEDSVSGDQTARVIGGMYFGD